MRRIACVLGVGIIIADLVLAFLAYFVLQSGELGVFDGLGRELTESPWLVRFVFGTDRMWAGWLWFLADMVIFFGGGGVGILLVLWGSKELE